MLIVTCLLQCCNVFQIWKKKLLNVSTSYLMYVKKIHNLWPVFWNFQRGWRFRCHGILLLQNDDSYFKYGNFASNLPSTVNTYSQIWLSRPFWTTLYIGKVAWLLPLMAQHDSGRHERLRGCEQNRPVSVRSHARSCGSKVRNWQCWRGRQGPCQLISGIIDNWVHRWPHRIEPRIKRQIMFCNSVTPAARHFDCIIEKRRGKVRHKKFSTDFLDVNFVKRRYILRRCTILYRSLQ